MAGTAYYWSFIATSIGPVVNTCAVSCTMRLPMQSARIRRRFQDCATAFQIKAYKERKVLFFAAKLCFPSKSLTSIYTQIAHVSATNVAIFCKTMVSYLCKTIGKRIETVLCVNKTLV